jgi:hypothetical protein
MVAKKKTGEKKGKVKVGKLELNKETVKDLTSGERRQIKGGVVVTVHYLCVPVQTVVCNTVVQPTCHTYTPQQCVVRK